MKRSDKIRILEREIERVNKENDILSERIRENESYKIVIKGYLFIEKSLLATKGEETEDE